MIKTGSPITEKEKRLAKVALTLFKQSNAELDFATEHLNHIKDFFAEKENITADEVFKNRAMLRIYRDKVVQNFSEYKVIATKFIGIINFFSSDLSFFKLIKSLISSTNDIESMIRDFVTLFDDLKNEEFSKEIIKSVDAIQEKSKEISDLLNDRLKKFLEENILDLNWFGNLGESKFEIEKDERSKFDDE